MKTPKLQLVAMFITTQIGSLQAELVVDAEGASLNSKGDLIDNGRTHLISRDGMVNSTGAVWDRELYDSNYMSIQDTSRRGGKGLTYTCLPYTGTRGKQRIEHIVQPPQDLSPGSKNYVGFSLMLDPSWETSRSGDWCNLHQQGQPGATFSFILFQIEPGTTKVRIRQGYGTTGNHGTTGLNVRSMDIATLQRGVWYDFVIGYTFSPNNASGSCHVWYKTASQSNYTQKGWGNIQVGYSERPNSITGSSIGLYRLKTPKWQRIYFDEVRVAGSFGGARIPEDGGVTPPSGWTQLEFQHSGKCVDNKGGTANGTEYHQWTCGAHANRNFRFESRGGGWWNIRSQKSNRCLDVAAGSLTNGGTLHQWDCSTSNINQGWKLEDQGGGWFYLVSQRSGKCVDVSEVSTSNQAKIHQWTCQGGGNQKLKFR